MTTPSVVSKPCAWLGVMGVIALCASRAEASPPFDLTGDAQGMGGLQAWTVPGSASAAYFNPALLIDSPTSVQLGLMVIGQQMAIALDGRPSIKFDVPAEIMGATHGEAMEYHKLDGKALPTRDLQVGRKADPTKNISEFDPRPRQAHPTGHESYAYMAFGIVVKAFEDHLALGVNGLVPFGNFTNIHSFFADEREQYFSNSIHPELYGDRLTAPSIAFGAGVKVIEGLSLGVGATLSLKANAVAPTYVADASDLTNILIDMDTGVEVSLVPHFGASYTLLDERLRLSATLHPPQQVEFATKFSFLLASGTEQASGVPFVLNYTPWMATFGASFDLVHEAGQTVTVAATLMYATWSGYVDRHGARPTPAYAWSDTLSPTLGMRYEIGRISTLLDLSYQPTPVPPQTGRTNYVDNDRLSTSVGAEYGFELFGTGMQVGLQLQPHFLLPRHQYKIPTPTDGTGRNLAPELVHDEVPGDSVSNGMPVPGRDGLQTNNPGWPGFSSSGFLFAASTYLRAAL